MKVTRIDIFVLGERGFPLVRAHLNEEQAKDFSTLLEQAQLRNPTTTADDVIRAIWRYGVRQTQRNLQSGNPIKVDELPGPITVKT